MLCKCKTIINTGKKQTKHIENIKKCLLILCCFVGLLLVWFCVGFGFVGFAYSFGAIFVAFNIKGDFMTQEALVKEIREVLAAIEQDLDPFVRGDIGRYTSYLAENVLDLQVLVANLLKKGEFK
jgi:hypothetical protein